VALTLPFGCLALFSATSAPVEDFPAGLFLAPVMHHHRSSPIDAEASGEKHSSTSVVGPWNSANGDGCTNL